MSLPLTYIATQLNVRIPRKLFDVVKAHSEATGVPMSRVVADALTAYRPTLAQREKVLAGVQALHAAAAGKS